MTDPKGYQPEGVKYTYPDDDPYQEGKEVYYNMAEFLNDDATEYDDMFYDFEFVEIKEQTNENN